TPIIPRSTSFSSQPLDYENSISVDRTPKSDPPLGQVTSQTKGPNTDVLSQKNGPLRPQLTSSGPVSMGPSAPNPARSPQSFRPPSRLVTDPLNRTGQRPQ